MKNIFLILILLSHYNLHGQQLEIEGDVDLKQNRIKNLSDPATPQDAATKAYVDNVLLNFGISMGTAGIQNLLNIGFCPVEIVNAGAPKDSLYGLSYQGGLIFYLDEQDTIDNLKGLICAPLDQSQGSERGCFGFDLPSVPNVEVFPPSGPGAEIGDGKLNTMAILSNGNCPMAPAALDCAEYMGGGFNDWFLPSAKELDLMWENLADSDNNGTNQGILDQGNLGAFTDSSYWSSTEVIGGSSWVQKFDNGSQIVNVEGTADRVRAVRAF